MDRLFGGPPSGHEHDEDGLLAMDEFLSVMPGDDDAAAAFGDTQDLFRTSPLPAMPGSPTLLRLGASGLTQQQPQHQQQQQGLPPWPVVPQQLQQQQHMWQLPPGSVMLQHPQQQHPQQHQLHGMMPVQRPLGQQPLMQQQQQQRPHLQQQQMHFQPPHPPQRPSMLMVSAGAGGGGSASLPASAAGSPQGAPGALSRQSSFQHQVGGSRQVSVSASAAAAGAKAVDAAALLAAAAPRPKRKYERRAPVGADRKIANAAAAAGAAHAALWKHTGPPKEPRIPREPRVEYEEILPPGLVVANTRPLPVPLELFQLSSLSDVLNLDTWSNVLDEGDRQALRALLPNKSQGFSEAPGGHLDQLLSGSANFAFGNPTAQLWEQITSGAAAPRVRRQQELLLQVKQQLAATSLRTYHNQQVSTFLEMQRLWDATLPPGAPVSARLEVWAAAQAGQVEVPESPRAAVQAAWAEETHKAAAGASSAQPQGAGAASGQQQRRQSTTSSLDGGGPVATAATAAAAAAAPGGRVVGLGSSASDYVYDTGVTFSKLTKRQQAALGGGQ